MGRRYGGLFVRIALIVMLALAPMVVGGCSEAGMSWMADKAGQ